MEMELPPEEGHPKESGWLDVPEIRRSIEDLSEGVRELSEDLEGGRAFLEEDRTYLSFLLDSDAFAAESGSTRRPPELLEKAREDVARMEAKIAQIEKLRRSLETLIEQFREVQHKMETLFTDLPKDAQN